MLVKRRTAIEGLSGSGKLLRYNSIVPEDCVPLPSVDDEPPCFLLTRRLVLRNNLLAFEFRLRECYSLLPKRFLETYRITDAHRMNSSETQRRLVGGEAIRQNANQLSDSRRVIGFVDHERQYYRVLLRSL